MEARRLVIPCVAIVFLVLAVLPPPLVRAGTGKGKSPRMTMTPRSQQQMRKFFKNTSSDDVGNDRTTPGQQAGGGKPGDDGSNGGGQAPATSAGLYLYSYQVGTPPQTVTGALSISGSLLWTTQCGSSSSSTTTVEVPCSSDACQSFVAQNCSAAETEAEPPCRYLYTYRSGEANTTGYLATESFTFGGGGGTRRDGLVFGCSDDSVGDLGLDGASGLIGLGRGPLSMLSQLDVGSFSYYLAPDDGASSNATRSFILFGDDAAPQTKRVVTTPLLASDDVYPDCYLVGLTGIRVDGKDLGIPPGTFDLRDDDGSGGVVLSISVPVTFLEDTAYKLLRQALVTRIGLPTANGSEFGLDVCYESQSLLATAKIPAVALVFDGGAVMDLEVGNYMYMDATSGLECLTILPSSSEYSDSRVSLLGSLIQAGTHMIYDINGSTLAFESLLQTSSSSPASPNNSTPGTPGGHRLSSAPPPHISSPMLFAHFLCLWAAVYLVF